jgi:plastocyanin
MRNFNLMAPDRSILLSEDVKPKMTITVDTGFLNSGNYAFYCFLHQYRGMEGMLMID